MNTLTQTDRIIAKLKEDGEITTVWAVQNYILRLAARINDLRKAGWQIDGKAIEGSRVFRYRLVAEPARV